MSKARLYVGTSGWSYSDWAKGRFYPKGMKQGDWLGFYAQHFDTVEVNMTFYRLPPERLLERWHDSTPSGFIFTLKLWQMITHRQRLVDCEDQLATFMDRAKALKRRRGPLLVQLPPSIHCDHALIEEFFQSLKKAAGRAKLRVSVEFRNQDWLTPETSDLLNELDAALCLADLDDCRITEPNAASFVYVRRHGPGGRYRGCYSKRHIQDDARKVRQWLEEGRDVYVYYNNDMDGHAVDNARQLRDAVEG